MPKNKKPDISAKRAAELFAHYCDLRREIREDHQSFTMPDFLETLTDEVGEIKVKVYPTRVRDELKDRAGAITLFGQTSIITVPDWMWESARKGGELENFVLAHECVHLNEGHHAHHGSIKNLQMSYCDQMNSIIAPDAIELEANYGAVFLLCGATLMRENQSAVELARWAHCDATWVRKAQRICQLDPFKKALATVMAKPIQGREVF